MKRSFLWGSALLFGLLASSMASCSNSDDPSFKDLKRVNIDLSAQDREVALSQYEFPVNLLSAAYKVEEGKNVMISPLSTSMVLGMVLHAVDDNERDEILKVMNLKESETDAFDSYVKKLMETLPGLDKNSTFHIDNGFWLIEKANLADAYSRLLTEKYFSELRRFEEFNLSTVDEINSWVKDKTEGGITDLLENEDAELELNTLWLNAVYFKGNWRQKFDKSRTEKKRFYPNFPDQSVSKDVEMMYGYDFRYRHYLRPKGSYDYDDAITSVMLPYGNESYIFTAVLPSKNQPDIQSTLRKLDKEYWQEIDQLCSYESDRPGDLRVRMPKIFRETKSNLIPILMNMGLRKIFDSLVGLSMEDNLALGRQYLQLFRQSVSLNVDEEGSEIKVATVAGGGDLMAAPPEIIEFDRPFIYFVRERSTGAVILAGVYAEP